MARLRELLAAAAPLVAPGAYDALSARLVEQAGFDVVYMTGFGTTASLLGRPDVGLLTGAEMVDNARRIVAAVDVPVIADADTGYGNAINVLRTVQRLRAGRGRRDPPRGPGDAQEVRPHERQGGDPAPTRWSASSAPPSRPGATRTCVLIARTDAAAVDGLDDAIAPGPGLRRRRRRRAVRRGADARGRHRAGGRRSCAAWRRWCSTGPRAAGRRRCRWSRIAELGFSLVIYPIGTLLAATAGMRALLATLRADGTPSRRWPGCPRSTSSPT